jgi:lysophospholipase L1-like esterase
VKVICIGDSCTYGQGVRSSEAWPAVLERLTGHDVRNAGVCGDTTRLGLERFFRDVAMHRPDAVVLQFGHNDANRWGTDFGVERVGLDSFTTNVGELIDRCHAIQAQVIVLRPHEPTRSYGRETDPGYEERVMLYAIALKQTVGDHLSHCAPVDSLLDDGYGVHPDPAMHQRYAGLVARVLGE